MPGRSFPTCCRQDKQRSQVGRGTQIQKVDNVFNQGSLETTELVTDLAVQGDSFFTVINPTTSEKLYTRAGAFHTDQAGYLVNPDGYRVGDAAGAAIQLTNLRQDNVNRPARHHQVSEYKRCNGISHAESRPGICSDSGRVGEGGRDHV